MDCNHRWRQVREEHHVGGTFPIGWECIDCGKFKGQHELGPDGLSGEKVDGCILYPPNGTVGVTSDGSPYTKQIVDESGKLTIERP